jgi:hypothetical protein
MFYQMLLYKISRIDNDNFLWSIVLIFLPIALKNSVNFEDVYSTHSFRNKETRQGLHIHMYL